MKLIIAIVRPHTIDKIVVALEDIKNFPGITVNDAEGFSQRLRSTDHDPLVPFKLYKRLEIACNDEMVEPIYDAIRQHAHTGKKGDGIIIVLPVEQGIVI